MDILIRDSNDRIFVTPIPPMAFGSFFATTALLLLLLLQAKAHSLAFTAPSLGRRLTRARGKSCESLASYAVAATKQSTTSQRATLCTSRNSIKLAMKDIASVSDDNVDNDDDGTVQCAMEQTVRRYFQGVHEKDPAKIRSCFGDNGALIHDIVVGNGVGVVPLNAVNIPAATTSPSPSRPVQRSANDLVQRCMDFCAAHPDVSIQFVYGPQCGRRSPYWVVTHWLETGTWSGDSCGIVAPRDDGLTRRMTCQGQTRCLVDPQTLHILELVVTRTYTEWESQLVLAQLTKP